jgi:hypothetical protein
LEVEALTCQAGKVIFLFDVDNPWLDNEHVVADLMRHLRQEWVRNTNNATGYFLSTAKQPGLCGLSGRAPAIASRSPRDSYILAVSNFLTDYSPTIAVPYSLDTLEHVRGLGAAWMSLLSAHDAAEITICHH